MTDRQALFVLRFLVAGSALAWTFAIDGLPAVEARRITLLWLAFVGALAYLAWRRWGSDRPRQRPPRTKL